MNYTASSVKTALEALIANKGLHSDNLKNVKCPIVSAIFEDGSKCHMNPKTCEKAHRQECVHRVSLFTKHNALYAAISFRFTISDTNYDGFIYEKDIQLMRLIQHGDIVETDLVKVPY
jgi:hypothetical protein